MTGGQCIFMRCAARTAREMDDRDMLDDECSETDTAAERALIECALVRIEINVYKVFFLIMYFFRV